MNIASRARPTSPFRSTRTRVDRAMDDAGIDVLLASSKHNVQYLLGGYKFIFFAAMDAIGHSRYLPVLIYEKGQPEHAGYLGNRMETGEHQVHPFWTPSVQTSFWGTVDAAKAAAAHLKKIGQRQGAHRLRAGVPVGRCLCGAARRAARRQIRRRDPCAGAHPRHQDAGRDRQAAAGVGADHRFHAGGVCEPGRGRVEAGDRRCAAARGDQSRPRLRILPAHLRLQPQPRRVAAALAEGRGAVDRFRRQLPWLYRRPLPHGGARRARCRARGYPGRDRAGAAGGDWRRPAPAPWAAT